MWKIEQKAFDDALRGRSTPQHYAQVAEAMMMADWALGKAGGYGAGEVEGVTIIVSALHMIGAFAESWDIVGDDTIVYHIRKGNHYGLNPLSESSRLAGGREADAYDAEYAFLRGFGWLPEDDGGYVSKPYAAARLTAEEQPLSIKALDKWTVEIKAQPAGLGSLFKWTAQSMNIYPPEVARNFNMNDARNHVGTGPFMITDYVDGVSTTFVRNPTYWQPDPVGPGKGNQIPYIDTLRWLYIPDRSTQMAALRTGKLDHLGERAGLLREEAVSLLQGNPGMKYNGAHQRAPMVGLRGDNPDLPWYDVSVRQAMFMAVDRETIRKDYYGGEADIYNYPVDADPMWISLGASIPFDELPASARELYTYNPNKAKQLLAEAGYPNGFKMEVILMEADVDLASLFKFYMAQIGVDVELAVKEKGVYTSIEKNRTHTEGFWDSMAAPYSWHEWRIDDLSNSSMVDDPEINKGIIEFAKYFMIDDSKAYPEFGKLVPRMIEQAYYIPMPSPLSYTVWWPWVRGYSGEDMFGATDRFGFTQYIWLDRELKQSMGY